MANSEKQGIDDEMFALYIECHEPYYDFTDDMKSFIRNRLKDLCATFEKELHFDGGSLKAVLIYWRDANGLCVILEAFSKALSPSVLMKMAMRAYRGCKEIVYRAALKNTIMVTFGKSLCTSSEVVDPFIFFMRRRAI